jgi:hypothetical protein
MSAAVHTDVAPLPSGLGMRPVDWFGLRRAFLPQPDGGYYQGSHRYPTVSFASLLLRYGPAAVLWGALFRVLSIGSPKGQGIQAGHGETIGAVRAGFETRRHHRRDLLMFLPVVGKLLLKEL